MKQELAELRRQAAWYRTTHSRPAPAVRRGESAAPVLRAAGGEADTPTGRRCRRCGGPVVQISHSRFRGCRKCNWWTTYPPPTAYEI
ncbi:MAG TPA: hypothetical protein VNJ11_01050 [Bryobacteraceae bacterium]|nr:hypothetical protein [Bryobacteraceae bacterium]